jgi:predicted PurR-regulated permease PerM
MGIFLLLFVGFLYLARPIVLPVVAGIMIGTLIAPATRRAVGFRVPSWLSALVVVVLLAGLIGVAIVALSGPVVEWIGKAPEIGARIKELLRLLERPLAALHDMRAAISAPDGEQAALKVDAAGSLLAPAIAMVTPAIGEILIFFGTLYFFLTARSTLRHQLVTLSDDRGTRLTVLRILNEFEQSLATYLSIVTVINLCLGTFMTGVLWLIGFPHPFVWGVVIFVLNYIPYLGPALVNLLFLLVGLISFPHPSQALLAPAIFLAVTTIEGHFMTPAIIGRSLTINPFAVFLALVFWTWLWGPFGAFLAAPLLIVGMVAWHHLLPKDEVKLPG